MKYRNEYGMQHFVNAKDIIDDDRHGFFGEFLRYWCHFWEVLVIPKQVKHAPFMFQSERRISLSKMAALRERHKTMTNAINTHICLCFYCG